MAAAVSSVANGGELIEPRVVRAVYRDDRRYAVTPKIAAADRSAADTAATLTTIMEQVVERGTAQARADSPATRSPGRPARRRSSSTAATRQSDYNASFVGVPAVAQPGGHDHRRDRLAAGGRRVPAALVAAPIFKRIAEATLRYLGVGPTINPAPPVLVARRDAVDVRTRPRRSDSQPIVSLVADGPPGTVPDLRGLSAREAVRTLVKLGLTAHVSGDGFVVSQDPPAGRRARAWRGLPPGAESMRSRTASRSSSHDVGRAPRRSAGERRDSRRTRSCRATPSRTVTGVAYDSRTRRARRTSSSRLKGLHADGAAFARQALERGAVADRRRSSRAPADVRRARGLSVHGRAARAGAARGDVLSASERGDAGRRHHRHERQDDDGVSRGVDLRGGGHPVRRARHGGVPDRRRAPRRDTHDARGARRAAAAPRDGRPRVRRLRDGSVVARAGAPPRRRDDVSRPAVFTNLTRDHLDFHGDMEQYFQAKRRLFEMLPRDAPSLLNVDDPRGASLAEIAGRPVTYAINKPADVTPGPLSFSLDGLTFDVRTPRGTLHVRSTLVGRPNVYNILAAVADGDGARTCRSTRSSGASQTLDGVPGRFQIVSSADDDVTVVVDYAHTDDALRNLLETARPLATRPADHGVRLRRRSRSDQAAADGRRRRPAERSHHHDVRQPAQRGSRRGSSRRSSAASRPTRDATAGSGCCRSSIAARRSARRSSWRSRAIWCSSPARGTRSTRSSATACCRSTTWRWRARRSRNGGRTRASYDARTVAGSLGPGSPAGPATDPPCSRDSAGHGVGRPGDGWNREGRRFGA